MYVLAGMRNRRLTLHGIIINIHPVKMLVLESGLIYIHRIIRSAW